MLVHSSTIPIIFLRECFGSIVVMTPIMYAILRETGAPRKVYVPFLVSVGFVADATSLPFSISNLVNIISVGFFSIPFTEYARVMIIQVTT